MEQDIYHALFYNLNPSTFATHHFHILFISYYELLHHGVSTCLSVTLITYIYYL
jgi:hypothetical protein